MWECFINALKSASVRAAVSRAVRRRCSTVMERWVRIRFWQKWSIPLTSDATSLKQHLSLIRKLILYFCKCQCVVVLQEAEFNILKRVLYLIINRYIKVYFVSRTTWNTKFNKRLRAVRFDKRSMSNINKIICLIILKSPENFSLGFNGSIGSVNIIHRFKRTSLKIHTWENV